jgi:hypothetical protein
MTALLETIADLTRPAEAAEELMVLNHRLAEHLVIPPDIQAVVKQITDAVDRSDGHWESVDPRHVEILLRSSLSAQLALMEPDLPASRDRLRLALDGLGQAFAAIAEFEPVADERPPKQLVAWLAARTEVSQARLARLLGVSPRQFQRWLSPSESAQPEGGDLRKVRAVARIVNQLRFALTPAGVIEWFDWPLPDLDGGRPVDLLDEPGRLPDLIRVAAGMRATTAT